MAWWSRNQLHEDLAAFVTALKPVVVVQPSSAAAERVFSVLTTTLDDSQLSALHDQIELSLMMRYNNRERLGTVERRERRQRIVEEGFNNGP